MSGERREHLLKVADAFYERLDYQNDGALGLDGKRPFGFSGGPESEILGFIGATPEAGGYWSEDQIDYAGELWGELAEFLRSEWEAHRATKGAGKAVAAGPHSGAGEAR